MSVEELMRQRYKVIADYPDSPYEVGEILEHDDRPTGELPDWNGFIDERAKKFPHLFKKLEWWEDRDFDLTGSYIRFGALEKAHTYYKLIKPIDGMYGFWEMFSVRENYYPLGGCFPATEQQYTDYINSLTK